ncbi:hypothetical protein BpHYR1_044103 [Brachionus plicatilis]|uniref:Uncharacterized protein n=1 Tax=Brachionus plicatilis TaxID=10195 RepID=A0A3M7QA31_BRAPC|nr:hypothetical protein BpHYR1_044103 [Brachionus plicatilis]
MVREMGLDSESSVLKISFSKNPDVRWCFDVLLATNGFEWVRALIVPPSMLIAKMCVVPRFVLTANHRLSIEKEMSRTLAPVSPRYSEYRCLMFERVHLNGLGFIWKTLKYWPRQSAVTSSLPFGLNSSA